MNVDSEVRRVKQRFGIIGESPALLAAIDRAVKVAPIDLSVLVTGESGAGKEFFPKIIHHCSARKHNKYIAVNCGAIPEGTIDSELFGHEKGAFTGAIATRKGYFEEADGGTIFLDEVAELPLTTQARLLRVLETGEFLKVGSSEVQKTDIRVVAATNVDLIKAVEQGKFREDLYYRLSTIQIHVPSLHERGGEDIEMLAMKFAADFSERYMTDPIRFSSAAVRLMTAYRWRGNVRQLKNVVEQMALFKAGDTIGAGDLSEALPRRNIGDAMPVRHGINDPEARTEVMWQMILSLRAEIEKLRRRIDDGERDERAEEREEREDHKKKGGYNGALIPYPDSLDAESREAYGEGEYEDDLLPCRKRKGGDMDSGVEDVEATAVESNDAPVSLEESEYRTILKALNKHGGSRKKAAAELNISERTLYRKLREYAAREDGKHKA